MLPCVLMLLSMHLEVGVSRDPINVYWNTTNPLFRREPTVVEVNRDTGPWEFDQLNLICPSGPDNREKHIVYSVSRDEFGSCEVASPAPKIVAVCDQPTSFLYFTITFRYFSPSPRQLEFQPGETYYFISTSEEGSLRNLAGGYCSSHHMKIQFRIADNHYSELKVPDDLVPVPTAFWSKYWRSRVPDARDIYHNNYEDDFRDLELLRGKRLPLKSHAAAIKSKVVLLLALVILCDRF